MSTINKKLMGFVFSGSALNLASASFKSNLNSISGFNPGGTGYTSFRPGNAFNSLTQLVQDGVYIVDTKTFGFDIPGATLTAGAPPAVAAVINKALIGFLYGGSSPLALASAPWKGNVDSITGFNSAGTGYTSFRPTSTFNSLTQLVQDGVYIINSATLGFSLPGAVVAQSAVPVTELVELLPAGYVSEAAPGFGGTLGDASLLRGRNYSSYLSGTGAYLTADFGAPATVTGLLVAPRTAEDGEIYHEGEPANAVLLGGSQPLVSITDPAGTSILTLPSDWLTANDMTQINASAPMPYRHILLGKSGLFSLTELRILGKPSAGLTYRPLAPTAEFTRAGTGLVSIKFSSLTASAQIAYTTDGTMPNVASAKVAQHTGVALPSSGTVTVQAVAVAADGATLSTDVATFRYVLDNSLTLQRTYYDTSGVKLEGLMSSLSYNSVLGLYQRITNDYRLSDGFQYNSPWKGALAYTSPNLIDWTRATSLGITQPFLHLPAEGGRRWDGFERPAYFHNVNGDGKHYIYGHTAPNPPYGNSYNTYGESKLAVYRADAPLGPFERVAVVNAIQGGVLDFSVFVDDNGDGYIIGSTNRSYAAPDTESAKPWNYQICAARIGADGITFDPHLVLDNRGSHEAPSMLKRKGIYYLTYSPAAGYAPSEMSYKTGRSLQELADTANFIGLTPFLYESGFTGAGQVSQNISEGTPFYLQASSIFRVGQTDATGQPAFAICGDSWKESDLGNSTYAIYPLHFDQAGYMYVEASQSNWNLATAWAGTVPAAISSASVLRIPYNDVHYSNTSGTWQDAVNYPFFYLNPGQDGIRKVTFEGPFVRLLAQTFQGSHVKFDVRVDGGAWKVVAPPDIDTPLGIVFEDETLSDGLHTLEVRGVAAYNASAYMGPLDIAKPHPYHYV